MQFIVVFMSIAYAAAVTSSDSLLLYAPGSSNTIQNVKRYFNASGAGNVNGNEKSYTKRRSYTATLSAALNGLRDYSGLQHISTSYLPVPTAATETSNDNLDGKAIDAKQQIPIYEEQPENQYAAAGASATAATSSGIATPEYNRENNQHSGNNALGAFIYNLHEDGTHNNYYGGSAVPTTSNEDWSIANDFDKSNLNSFQHHYEHNSAYNAQPTYAEENPYKQQLNQNEYSTEQLFQPYYTSPEGADNDAHYEEPTNYLSRPDEHAESTTDPTQQQPDVINYVPYPVYKKLHVPVRQHIQIPISHAVIMPIRRPVPIHIPITQQIQVPVERDLKIPVERVVPYPVEKHVPVPVEKRVPYPLIRYVPVKVPRPYPIKVPVYKTVLHKMKSLW